jgi:hypothetical protein
MSLHRATLALCLALLPANAWGWASWDPQAGPKGALPGDVGTQCEDLSAEPITYGMLYDDPVPSEPGEIRDMHDVWLVGGCVGCHNNTAMGGVRLDVPIVGYSNLYFQPSFRNPDIFRVLPSEPESSLLNAMLSCLPPDSYPAMPPPIDQMSQRIPRRLRAFVYDWIKQGARAVNEAGAPIGDVVFRDHIESDRLQRNVALPQPPLIEKRQ